MVSGSWLVVSGRRVETSALTVFSWFAWLVTLGLLTLGSLDSVPALTPWGLGCSALAATLSICGHMEQNDKALRAAFEFGRETERIRAVR